MDLKLCRRLFFQNVFASAVAAQSAASQTGQQPQRQATPADSLPGAELKRKLKVVFVGAHVDDWIDCAGTIARYSNSGHEALLFSFTPGDSRSMADMNHLAVEEIAAIRRKDALQGAKILGAELRFLEQHNQNMQVNPD